MKRIYLSIALVLAALLLTMTACGGDDPTTETQGATETSSVTEAATEAPTETPTEAPTVAPTEPITDAPTEPIETEEVTEAETEPPKKYREDWDSDDPENPYLNLIKVGKSYDGVTDCYDGRYDFGYTVASVNGVDFTSVQDAIDYIEGIGGNIMITASTNICLKVDIPEDGCFYRMAYNFYNVDFVLNCGIIYDDCAPNEEGVRGFAYYSDLYELDSIAGLDGTYAWIINDYDIFEPGRYMMTDEYVDDDDYLYLYNFQRDSGIDNWEGLPHGEVLP